VSDNIDILLTYSSKDDQPEKSDIGWVSSLKGFLEALLQQMLKKEIHVEVLNEGGDHSEESYKNVSIMVSCLSSSFLNTPQLVTGIQNFVKRFKGDEGLYQNNLPRFFKVFKSPTEIGVLPGQLEPLISYNFFDVNSKTGEAEQYDRFFGGTAEKKFWMKLVDMAYDISQLLVSMNPEYAVYENIKKGDEVIYLAGCGVDLVNQRDIIRRELIRYGYRVLPNRKMKATDSDLKKSIKNDLSQCNLSIHLIGEDYGQIIPDQDKSLVQLENEVATLYSASKEAQQKEGGFRRLIWITPKFSNLSERQKIFIEDLRSDAESLENAEILQTSIHDLRTVLRNQLIYKQKTKRFDDDEEVEEGGPSMVYLIVDRDDVEESKPLIDFLNKQGFRVLSSSFEGDLIDLRNLHQENLRKCDGSIIYYGKANEEWMKTKIQDLLKSPGFGRKKPMKAKAIISNEDRKLDPTKLERTNALVLYNKGKINEELLLPFLERLKN
jgi:hypothetical protein